MQEVGCCVLGVWTSRYGSHQFVALAVTTTLGVQCPLKEPLAHASPHSGEHGAVPRDRVHRGTEYGLTVINPCSQVILWWWYFHEQMNNECSQAVHTSRYWIYLLSKKLLYTYILFKTDIEDERGRLILVFHVQREKEWRQKEHETSKGGYGITLPRLYHLIRELFQDWIPERIEKAAKIRRPATCVPESFATRPQTFYFVSKYASAACSAVCTLYLYTRNSWEA